MGEPSQLTNHWSDPCGRKSRRKTTLSRLSSASPRTMVESWPCSVIPLMTDIGSRRYTGRRTRVCVPGAYVLTTPGSREKPDSSTQTIVRPSLRAFLEFRPSLDLPRLEHGLVALGCPFDGHRRRPVQSLEQPRDLGFVVGHAKLCPEDPCHAGARPHMTAEAIGLSPMGQHRRQQPQWCARQLDRSTRKPRGAPGFSPELTPGSHPRAHSRLRNIESGCDGPRLPPLCLQFTRPLSASFFPVARKRMRVHACMVARRQKLSYRCNGQ